MTRLRAQPATHWVAGWIRLLPQASLVSFGVAGVRFFEVLVSPPLGKAPLLAVALLASSVYWLAGLLLGALALIAWAGNRALGLGGISAPPAPPGQWTQETRLRSRGFSIVAGWVVLSLVTSAILGETRTGPAARFATSVLGLRDFSGPATFLLTLPVLLVPLLLLASLPWQARWPLVAGMQAAVKPPSVSTRPRKRG